MPTLRISTANWLYMIVFLLVLTIGAVLQSASPAWGLLATELVLILAPSLLVITLARLPVGQSLQLDPPTRQTAGWSALVGFGLGLFSQWLLGFISSVSGYTLPLLPQAYPTAGADQGIYLLSLVAAAPVCEELLFRGLILPSYRAARPWKAILISALLFAAIHASLQRALVLMPMALAAGYVLWRTRSLWSSILLHVAYNLPGALLLTMGGEPFGLLAGFVGPFVSGFGLLLALWGLRVIRRQSHPEVIDPLPDGAVPKPTRRESAAAVFPLVLCLPLFVIPAGAELAQGRFPQYFADPALIFQDPQWSGTKVWRYELWNIRNAPVGAAECHIAALEQVYRLDCRLSQQAFEASVPGSYFNVDAVERSWSAEWRKNDLHLQAFEQHELQRTAGESRISLISEGVGSRLEIVHGTGITEQLPLKEDSLLPNEWAWRLQALPLGYPLNAKATLARPLVWSENDQQARPLLEDVLVRVLTAERVSTPAGSYLCWKVSVGRLNAWYSVQAPHILVRYDDGIVSFRLQDGD